MPRTLLSYQVADVSAAARSLREQLQKLERLPSHVELLNMLARAAGFRNFQHFRADSMDARASRPPSVAKDVRLAISPAVEKAARYFDSQGRLTQWPSKESQAKLCLWVIWSQVPSGQRFTEREISDLLKDLNAFDDHALLRRALVDYELVVRTPTGSAYRRIKQPPPPELAPLLERLGLK
jgi:hypothetical protein